MSRDVCRCLVIFNGYANVINPMENSIVGNNNCNNETNFKNVFFRMHDINERMAIKALKYIKDIIQRKINKMQKTFVLYIEIFGRVFAIE